MRPSPTLSTSLPVPPPPLHPSPLFPYHSLISPFLSFHKFRFLTPTTFLCSPLSFLLSLIYNLSFPFTVSHQLFPCSFLFPTPSSSFCLFVTSLLLLLFPLCSQSFSPFVTVHLSFSLLDQSSSFPFTASVTSSLSTCSLQFLFSAIPHSLQSLPPSLALLPADKRTAAL